MRSAPLGLVVVAVTALLVGCGGGDADVPAFTGAPSGSSTRSGTEPSGTVTGTGSGGFDPSGAATGDGPVTVEAAEPLPTDAEDAAVVQAYLDFWRADAAALADPEEPLTALGERLVDPQRTRTLAFITEQRAQGLRSVGTIRTAPVVSFADGSRAVVDDCLDDTGLTAVDSGGDDVPGSAGSRQPVRVVLTADSGTWLISDLLVRDDPTCA